MSKAIQKSPIITSAKTARKQIPALYQKVKKSFGWVDGTINLDIGGGPWDLFTEILTSQGVTNLVYDPYNRDNDHNQDIMLKIAHTKVIDTVTIANVLNVIKSREDRESVLVMSKIAHRVYITVYEGDGDGNSRTTRDGWQEHRKITTYLDEVKSIFPDSHIVGKMIVCWNGDKTNV